MAGQMQAEADARTEQAVTRLRDIRKEIEAIATPEEKIVAIRDRLAALERTTTPTFPIPAATGTSSVQACTGSLTMPNRAWSTSDLTKWRMS